MYLWRLFIAISLGLVWYLCDSGRTAAQYFICFLFFFTTPLLSRDSGRESSTQTDGETKDTLLQATVEEVLEDVPDGGIHVQAEPLESSCPLVKRSLQQVFECAYAQLVLPWYNVPELLEHQPLHRVLSVDVDFVIDQIIERAKDFNVCQVVVGSIRLLTQHLHNAKQSDRELAFFSRAEEVAILREFSGVLVRNLFPKSHWDQKVNRCALNEIVALKGLGLLVTWLSDPDNLNQLVVNQLDSVTPKGSVEELCGSDLDAASVASQEGDDAELSSEGAGVSASSGKAKKKRNKLKVHLSKFVDKMKSKKAKKKKMKKVEHELVMRAMEIPVDVSNEDDISSREGSVLSLLDSDREDSDLENYMTTVQEDMMEFKLSYEMWRVGCWAVSIPHADVEDEELVFSIHVEEKDSPENLHWDIKKTYMDVIYFRNRWQDSTNLPSITALEESEVNDEVKEEARVSVEHFLQELVSDNLIGHTQPVFLFLCPLDKLLNEEEHYGGVWGLLSGLASFLTPGQEEEESSSLQTQVPKEILTSSSSHLASTALPSENLSPAKDSPVAAATVPTIIVSTYDPPSDTLEEADAEAEPPSTNETCSQDKAEDSDNPFTSHFKMIFKGLSRSRSQESLVSAKSSSDDDPPDSVSPHCSQNGVLPGESTEGIMWRALGAELNKKEKIISKLTGGPGRAKGKEQGTLSRAEDSRVHKIQAKWEQAEVTKALFDLLKEISGNSILMNVFDAMLKPFKPMLNKKVNSFLSTMDPTEAQVASLIDSLRDKQWPESQPAAASPPRSDEEKSETRERAHSLINGRYCSSLVLKKTDMDAVFSLFQKQEENKMLLYMLLSFLLRELFPNENSLTVSAAFLQKVINSSN